MTIAQPWMYKHPCTACDTGYGFCAEGLFHNLKCCKDCDHPSRWQENAYTKEDILDMWVGREMPDHVKKRLEQM